MAKPEPPDQSKVQKPARRKQQRGTKAPLSDYPNLGTPSVSPSTKVPSFKDTLKKEVIYTQKSVMEHVSDISFEDADDRDIEFTTQNHWSLKERYLGNQNYPFSDGKHRYVYESMLTGTGSCVISHNLLHPNDKIGSPITHSKCYITKILGPREWGFELNKPRLIQATGISFTYWDYIQAWSYAFYYQNPIRNHTWFFSINPKIITNPSSRTPASAFPSWFVRWWDKFGPCIDILPDELQQQFTTWQLFQPVIKEKSNVSQPIGWSSLWFFTEFHITWVWKWSFCLHYDVMKIPTLQRTFFYKWWDKFDTEATVEKAHASIEGYYAIVKEERKKKILVPGVISLMLCSKFLRVKILLCLMMIAEL